MWALLEHLNSEKNEVLKKQSHAQNGQDAQSKLPDKNKVLALFACTCLYLRHVSVSLRDTEQFQKFSWKMNTCDTSLLA